MWSHGSGSHEQYGTTLEACSRYMPATGTAPCTLELPCQFINPSPKFGEIAEIQADVELRHLRNEGSGVDD